MFISVQIQFGAVIFTLNSISVNQCAKIIVVFLISV